MIVWQCRVRCLIADMKNKSTVTRCLALLGILAVTATATASDATPLSDIPQALKPPVVERDYTRRVEMIPMRDGVKLHTVILVPKNARNAPILLTRTPYNATKRSTRS